MSRFPVPPLVAYRGSTADIASYGGASNALSFTTKASRYDAYAYLKVPNGGSVVDALPPGFDWSWSVVGGSATAPPLRLTLTFFVESPDGRLFRPAIMSRDEIVNGVTIGSSGTVAIIPSYSIYNEETHNADSCDYWDMAFHEGYPYAAVRLMALSGTFSNVTVASTFSPHPIVPPDPEPEGMFWTGYQKLTEALLP